MRGCADRKIEVTTDDPRQPKIELVVDAKVLIPMRAIPNIVVFRNVDRNAEALEATVTLERGDGGPIKPEVPRTKGRGLEATIREIEPGERYELDVRIQRPYPNRALKSPLQINTGVSEVPSMVLEVIADIPARIATTPSRFTLPHVIDQPFEEVMELEWVGADGYTVVRVEANIRDLTVRAEKKDGRQLVILRVPAGYKRARGTFPKVTIHTDDPDLPVFSVPVNTAGPARGSRDGRPPDAGGINLTPPRSGRRP